MRALAWRCILLLLCAALPAPPAAAADGFAHHVIAVELAPKDEQHADPTLTDFYIDMGRAEGALPGTEFWVYRVEWVGPERHVVIPVGRLEALQIEERVTVARLKDLTVPADHPLVEYRTIMVGDAVEPILGTGILPLGERDLPVEQMAIHVNLVPPPPDAARAVRTFSIPNMVLFDFDKSTLRPEGRAILTQVAEFARQTKATAVRVEGHTDAIGTRAYNRRLSERRATAVKRFLARASGISAAALTAVGYGETRPLASNGTEAGRQRNRRCEITVDGRQPERTVPDGLAIAPSDLVPEGGGGTMEAVGVGSRPATQPASAAASQGEAPFPELARPQ